MLFIPCPAQLSQLVPSGTGFQVVHHTGVVILSYQSFWKNKASKCGWHKTGTGTRPLISEQRLAVHDGSDIPWPHNLLQGSPQLAVHLHSCAWSLCFGLAVSGHGLCAPSPHVPAGTELMT